jgi:[acyl-carrier-protein] S-malonyltransferase
MGRDLYANFAAARAVFDEADEALGFALSQIVFEGPEETLRLTEHTQPAILTVSTAAVRVLTEALGFAPKFAAGHSLGEYSAHVAAGTLTFADAVRAVRLRGRYMQQAVPAGEGAMAAILGLDPGLIRVICEQVEDQLTPLPGDPEALKFVPGSAVVSPANLNSPGQTVISGAVAAVERAAELCKQAGAKRAVMLPVSALPLQADAAGAGSAGERSGRRGVPRSSVSGSGKCECRANHFRQCRARRAGGTGDRGRALGGVH